jgi:uncharacterized protein YkwD
MACVLGVSCLVACGPAEVDDGGEPDAGVEQDTGPACEEEGEIVCDGECEDVSTSVLHCGSCGNACGLGAACSGGDCICLNTQTWCGPGQCVNLETSRSHCGECGKACVGAEYCLDGECVDDGVLGEVILLTNEARKVPRTCGETSHPAAGALSAQPQLTEAAQGHAEDMARRDFFAHDNPDGTTATQRMRAAGYTGGRTGENIAQGYSTAREVVDAWIDSPGHCRNLMSGNYTEIGIGYYRGGPGRHYWVQNFGAP